MDYWKECIAEAMEDAGITATDEQIDTVTSWVEGAYENYGLATGLDAIPNPLRIEIASLERDLRNERDKDHCKEERARADEWRRTAERLQFKVRELREELNRVGA